MSSSNSLVVAPMPSHPTCSASVKCLRVSTPMCGTKTGICSVVPSVSDALQVAVGRHRNQEFALEDPIDLEAARLLQKFVYRRLRVVPFAPQTAGEEVVGQVFDDCVEHDQVASFRHKRRVEL